MLEVKVNVAVTAPELTGAINNLAVAISNKNQPNVPMSAPVNSAPVSVAPVQPTPPTPVEPSEPAASAVPLQQPATPVTGVPLANAPQFTVDQIMAAGAALMDAGKVEDLLNLLHSFGVQAVTELKPEQLGAFATELRKLGAAI